MTDKLPPNLLALFAPRPALRYLPPSDHSPEDRKTPHISGVAQFLDKLKEPTEYTPTESWLEKRDRRGLEKTAKQEKLVTEEFAKCTMNPALLHPWFRVLIRDLLLPVNPADDPQVRGDGFKTLFVARLSYDAKESDLEREFGRFGPIERV